MKSRVANESLADLMDRHTVVGAPELWHAEGDRLRCLACGHRCLIGPGLRGICKVRYHEADQLKVPFGYVAGLQCDPVEKKPFFHVYPGSDALTFGMLGCDLHCSYCFPGETPVVTDRGPLTLAEAFASAARIDQAPDAEIAYPDSLQAVAASGTFRRIRAVFKHPYRGPLVVLRPYYLPALLCTPDHRVYATIDPAVPPQPVPAGQLTDRHFLTIPRQQALSSAPAVVAGRKVAETEHYYLVPLRERTLEDYAGDVYNLEVEEEHNYLAGLFLVSNCQNWLTSQALRDANAVAPLRPVTPAELVGLARRERARLVVSSYNEPLITAEWAVSVFREARTAGLACAFVSNGNATPEVLDYLRPWICAYKVDLKGFTEQAYRSLGGTLDNITRTIRLIHERGLWLEIVTLIIPGFNDDPDELRRAAEFLASVDPNIPWHVTAFHRDYKMTQPDPTSAETLMRAAEIGTAAGLRFVYAGNLPGRVGPWENTRCPSCRATLIERFGYLIRSYRVTPDGRCPSCQSQLPGVWPGSTAEVKTGHALAAYQGRLPRTVPLPTIPLTLPGGTPAMPAVEPVRSLSALSDAQRQQIVGRAAALLRSAVLGRPAPAADLAGWREQPVLGVFVSLKRGNHLRCCMGLLGDAVPLSQALETAAFRTAREDVRFPPVSPTELDHLDLEVWLLHNLQPVPVRGADRVNAITLGKHGIKVVRGEASGLFLPSVPVENNWDVPRYLDQVCLKAGLPPSAWREDATALFTFEGEALRSPAATRDPQPEATPRPHGFCPPEQVQLYAGFCRDNLLALLTGRLPNYYLLNAPDGNVAGLVLSLRRPDAAEEMSFSQLSLRHGLPLQSTLFNLTQAAAQRLGAEQLHPQFLTGVQTGVALLTDPVPHGTVGDPHLAGLEPRQRAILVLERNKSALLFDPQRGAEELLSEAASQARVTDPATAAVFSLDALTNTARLSVTTVPKPIRGPAVRPACTAGTFIDADPAALAQRVDQLLAGERRSEAWPAALVPHAGLRFSGHIAGAVLRRLHFPRHVIVIGPKHTAQGMDWAVAPHQTWALPGGSIEADFIVARQLSQAIPGLELDAAAHQGEHAIEVELPLLARLAPESRVVGIAIGHASLDDCRRIAAGLAGWLRERAERPLLLISSDMNHFATDSENRRLDELALAALDRCDPTALYDTVTRHSISMCGVLPAVIVLETLRLLGIQPKAERVGYATSADVTGDKNRVVGYAGMLFGGAGSV